MQLMKSRKKISNQHGLKGYGVLDVAFSHHETILVLIAKEGHLAIAGRKDTWILYLLAPTHFSVH